MLHTIANPNVLRDVKQRIRPLDEKREWIVSELTQMGMPIQGPTEFPAKLDDIGVDDCRAIALRRSLGRIKRRLKPLQKIAAFTRRTLVGD